MGSNTWVSLIGYQFQWIMDYHHGFPMNNLPFKGISPMFRPTIGHEVIPNFGQALHLLFFVGLLVLFTPGGFRAHSKTPPKPGLNPHISLNLSIHG